MQTTETKPTVMTYISIAAASVVAVIGLEGCMSAYQPEVTSGIFEYWSSDRKKKLDSVQLDSEIKAKKALGWIVGADCGGRYPELEEMYNWMLIASDELVCEEYVCVRSENCGRESDDCRREYDWVERWKLDLNDIQFMYAQSGYDGTDIEIITTKGIKKNVNFKDADLGEKAADIIYTFFCKGCNK